MSKALTRLMLAAAAVSLCACAAAAQTTLEWIVLSPAGEEFTARMPTQPAAVETRLTGGGMFLTGTRYAAAPDGRTTYVVWSLQNPDGVLLKRLKAEDGDSAESSYLDHVAELAWELLVTPELERLKQLEMNEEERSAAAARVGMGYVRPFNIGGQSAREYSVGRVSERGHVYVCADGARVYVVAALGAAAGDARLRQFVDSFAFKGAAPVRDIAVGPGRGVNVGGGDPVNPVGGGAAPADDDRPFRQSEVTKKAVITFKPEPGFTEWARRFNVTGVVRLRAILHSSGEMRNISVVKTLPHGLTGKSLAAARQMRFEPAQKDGRAVSQYVVLEYNFNIY